MIIFRLKTGRNWAHYNARRNPPYYNPLIISFAYISYFLDAVIIRLENRSEKSRSGRFDDRKDRRIPSLRSEWRNRFALPPQPPSPQPPPPKVQRARRSCDLRKPRACASRREQRISRTYASGISGRRSGLLRVWLPHSSRGIPYRHEKDCNLGHFERPFWAV